MTSHGHRHGHHHDHEHDHGHDHAPRAADRAFVVSIGLNLGFVAVKLCVAGVLARSMALVADAGHNLGDVLGLALAWGAGWLARRKPSKLRTYGFRRATILAALANAVLLLFATGGIAWESLPPAARARREHGPARGKRSSVVASGGRARERPLGARPPARRPRRPGPAERSLHLLGGRGLLPVGVALTGVVLVFRHWPLLRSGGGSRALGSVIVWSAWGLLRRSVNLALDAVPEGVRERRRGARLLCARSRACSRYLISTSGP